jgi:hypothetical protein
MNLSKYFFESDDSDDDDEEVITHWINSGLDFREMPKKNLKRKRVPIEKQNLNNLFWMKLYHNPLTCDISSREGKNFRQRFRLPHALVKDVLIPMVIKKNIFKVQRKSYIPIELKVMICLRILARGNVYDDIQEMTGIGNSTVASIYLQFVNNFVNCYFQEFVSPPEGDDLEDVMKIYEVLGLPGAIGSMDCTHIDWGRCPVELFHSCKGMFVL